MRYGVRSVGFLALLAPAALAAPSSPPPPPPLRPPTAPIEQPGDVPITIGFGRDLPSRVLGGTRRINVHVPEGADQPGSRPVVLVLLDGGVKEDFLHIAGLTDLIGAYGAGPRIVVIGIEGVDRRHDLTSPSSVPSDVKAAPTSGGADAYRRFLAEELRPWIDTRFPGHGRVALIGESLAGLFTLETCLKGGAGFDDFIAVSPSLWWNDGGLVRAAPALLRAKGAADRRLWIGFDTPAPPPNLARRERALQDALVGALRAAPKGMVWSARRLREGHATVYHPAALKALRQLYPAAP
ncbi:MAG: hypothetical protein K2X73_02240 [Sphingomonas sp.]|uniref:alpha/beta hydrolase n=1 Tax=Sphingomonas sp. TaxID=28214 RepID=UPI0025F43D8D|nr:alpha/beta hydrolase-fold protein [Sphingomonas sp.]MBX9880773.1 hypothetical protein [Sphingomonas sp.]